MVRATRHLGQYSSGNPKETSTFVQLRDVEGLGVRGSEFGVGLGFVGISDLGFVQGEDMETGDSLVAVHCHLQARGVWGSLDGEILSYGSRPVEYELLYGYPRRRSREQVMEQIVECFLNER